MGEPEWGVGGYAMREGEPGRTRAKARRGGEKERGGKGGQASLVRGAWGNDALGPLRQLLLVVSVLPQLGSSLSLLLRRRRRSFQDSQLKKSSRPQDTPALSEHLRLFHLP